MISFKICLMGAFSVGKTSLVRRFVHQVFDERYTTSLGVKIETKVIELGSGPLKAETVKLVIWDMEGADSADHEGDLVTSRMKAYLQGVDAVMLVADGTREVTLETVLLIHDWLQVERAGTPAALLLNKADLVQEWQLTDADIEAARGAMGRSIQCFTTSALSGAHVESTFNHLAQILSERE